MIIPLRSRPALIPKLLTVQGHYSCWHDAVHVMHFSPVHSNMCGPSSDCKPWRTWPVQPLLQAGGMGMGSPMTNLSPVFRGKGVHPHLRSQQHEVPAYACPSPYAGTMVQH